MNGTTTSDPVSKVLLPVLVHEVNNATQLLVGLRALLDLPGGEGLFSQRADDLARTSQRMDELGLALAVLATANGANMMLARRDERTVRILWLLAVRSLERVGGARVSATGEPPRITTAALDGWQPAWAAAALLLHASQVAPADEWRWRWDDAGALTGRGPTGARLTDDTVASIADRVPGATIERAGDDVTWRMPDDWIARD